MTVQQLIDILKLCKPDDIVNFQIQTGVRNHNYSPVYDPLDIDEEASFLTLRNEHIFILKKAESFELEHSNYLEGFKKRVR